MTGEGLKQFLLHGCSAREEDRHDALAEFDALVDEVRRLREENERLRRGERTASWTSSTEVARLRRIKEAARKARQEAREGATEGGALARGRLVVIHGLLDEALESEPVSEAEGVGAAPRKGAGAASGLSTPGNSASAQDIDSTQEGT